MLSHDIGVMYVPVVVNTSTSVGEPVMLVQVIESVSPGWRVIDRSVAGSEFID